MPTPAELKAQILRLTREYSRLTHTAQRPGDDSAQRLAVRHDAF